MIWVIGALSLAAIGWGLYRYHSRNRSSGADSSTALLSNSGSSGSGDTYSSDSGGGDSGGSE